MPAMNHVQSQQLVARHVPKERRWVIRPIATDEPVDATPQSLHGRLGYRRTGMDGFRQRGTTRRHRPRRQDSSQHSLAQSEPHSGQDPCHQPSLRWESIQGISHPVRQMLADLRQIPFTYCRVTLALQSTHIGHHIRKVRPVQLASIHHLTSQAPNHSKPKPAHSTTFIQAEACRRNRIVPRV